MENKASTIPLGKIFNETAAATATTSTTSSGDKGPEKRVNLNSPSGVGVFGDDNDAQKEKIFTLKVCIQNNTGSGSKELKFTSTSTLQNVKEKIKLEFNIKNEQDFNIVFSFSDSFIVFQNQNLDQTLDEILASKSEASIQLVFKSPDPKSAAGSGVKILTEEESSALEKNSSTSAGSDNFATNKNNNSALTSSYGKDEDSQETLLKLKAAILSLPVNDLYQSQLQTIKIPLQVDEEIKDVIEAFTNFINEFNKLNKDDEVTLNASRKNFLQHYQTLIGKIEYSKSRYLNEAVHLAASARSRRNAFITGTCVFVATGLLFSALTVLACMIFGPILPVLIVGAFLTILATLIATAAAAALTYKHSFVNTRNNIFAQTYPIVNEVKAIAQKIVIVSNTRVQSTS